jgi:hypothetical protein
MKIKHIVIAAMLHFTLLVVFYFLALGATLGLGFKDELTTFDMIYKFISINGMKILAGWGWLFQGYLSNIHVAIQWLVVLINSLTQGVLFLFVYRKWFSHNAT